MLEPEWGGKVNRTQLAVRRTNTLASSHPEAVLLACGMGIFWHDATQTAARGSKSAFIYVCTRCVRIIGRSLRLGVWSLSDWRWEPAEWILMVSSWACDCHLNTHNHINQHGWPSKAFLFFILPLLHLLISKLSQPLGLTDTHTNRHTLCFYFIFAWVKSCVWFAAWSVLWIAYWVRTITVVLTAIKARP